MGRPPPQNTAEEPLVPGDVVDGKYRIIRLIGEGAMGMVLAATHLRLDELVAIKVLHGELLYDEKCCERFAREARATAMLRNDHVARVIDVGDLPNGLPYMVMEYLDGRDLGELLIAGDPVTARTAVSWIVQACTAVEEAHQQGIVHRDLKPENLFLARRPDGSQRIKVLDFGVSKWLASGPASWMRSQALTTGTVGTPAYMAPEQLTRGGEIGPSTDVWALGVILYELLAGRHPFEASALPQVVALIMHAEPTPLRLLAPTVPEAIADVVHRCLQKDGSQRISSVTELMARLREAWDQDEESPLSIRRVAAITMEAEHDRLAEEFESDGDATVRRHMSFTSPAIPFAADPVKRRKLGAVLITFLSVTTVALVAALISGDGNAGPASSANPEFVTDHAPSEPIVEAAEAFEPAPSTNASARPAPTVEPVAAPVESPTPSNEPPRAESPPTKKRTVKKARPPKKPRAAPKSGAALFDGQF